MKRFTYLSMFAVMLSGSPFMFGQGQDEFFLAPGAAVSLPVDAKVQLRVIKLKWDGSQEDSFLDLNTAVTWTVNGNDPARLDPSDGRFTIGMPITEATYMAPHTIPTGNPVAVAVSFRPSPSSQTKTILVCNVTVVDRGNFFHLAGKGAPEESFRLDDGFSTPAVRNMLARAAMAGPELMVNVGAMQPGGAGGGVRSHSNATMTLNVAGAAPGQYPWTLPANGSATTVMLMIAGGAGMDQYSTGDCLPHGVMNCKAVSTAGVTRITSYDPKTNEVEGEFRGTVVKLVNGQPSSYAFTSGSFRVAMQSLTSGFHP